MPTVLLADLALREISGDPGVCPSPGGGPSAGLIPCFSVASYLVDPSSSHMLVSKIKPCMSKYNPLEGETAKGSLNHT